MFDSWDPPDQEPRAIPAAHLFPAELALVFLLEASSFYSPQLHFTHFGSVISGELSSEVNITLQQLQASATPICEEYPQK